MFDTKYETLAVISEIGSYTKAAEELSITQPAVSNHIKLIEQELGIKVFLKTSSGLKLTDEGATVLKYTKRMMGLYDKMLTDLTDVKTKVRHLTVGITHTSESNLIAEMLAKFCKDDENIKMTVVTDSLNNLYNKLKTYDISFAIVDGNVSDDKVDSILLNNDYLVLAVSNNNKLAKKDEVTIDELKKERMILRLPDSGTSNLFASTIESNNLSISDFNVYMQVDNIATIKDLIRRDFGVSVLAKSACMDEVKKGKMTILPIKNLNMSRETNLIYLKDFEHRDILDIIVSIYKNMIFKV